MKTKIHPKFYLNSKATCACGAEYVVGSTIENFGVEICVACHPYYSKNSDKTLDQAGRIDRFKKRASKATKDK